MTFDEISGDGRLWAVRYDGDSDNILYLTLGRWYDIEWLADFFANNKEDLADYFKITDLNQAIYDTISDEMLLGKEKAKGKGVTDLDGFSDFVENTQI